jgi:hypothetical protein
MSAALEIAKAEVDKFNLSNGGKGGIAHVARKIGIARPSLSLFLNGKYTAQTDQLEKTILSQLVGRVPCPHLQVDIALRDCETFATRAMPMSRPKEFRHWKACQVCKLKPTEGDNA